MKIYYEPESQNFMRNVLANEIKPAFKRVMNKYLERLRLYSLVRVSQSNENYENFNDVYKSLKILMRDFVEFLDEEKEIQYFDRFCKKLNLIIKSMNKEVEDFNSTLSRKGRFFFPPRKRKEFIFVEFVKSNEK